MARHKCLETFVRLFEYNTAVVLHSNSKTIGITFRVLQFCIFVFIFVYYIGYKGGYKITSYAIIGSTTIIRRDLDDTTTSKLAFPFHMDLKATNNIMLLVSALLQHQERAICPEDPRTLGATCDPYNNKCSEIRSENGVTTGNCIRSNLSYLPSSLRDRYTCEIKGWCTQEETTISLMNNHPKEVTLIVQNHVYFPEFAEQGHLRTFDESLLSCWTTNQYYSPFNPRCPVFKLRTIAEEAAQTADKYFTFDELLETGGIILMRIIWDCDFDIQERDKQCTVKYEFRRLDRVNDATLRTTDFKLISWYVSAGRAVAHMSGVHILTSVEGRARKMDLFTCVLKFGAGVGLFALASVICELLLTFACCQSEQRIRDMKYVEARNDKKESENLILGKEYGSDYVYV